ncbi:MAG: VirB3 family type IV secretion system protein [Acidobacteria bacterium]|nr:VirB3 family type IV secretion system protein [Acidobacteriota bacterium]
MANEPRVHPVYTSINKPLTIWGAERRLFLLALMLGAAVFNLFGSLPGGLLTFAFLYAGARLASATDPQILRILLNSARVGRQYDPITLAPLAVRRSRLDADVQARA